MNSYFLKSALLPQGWCHDVRVTTELGVFKTIELDSKPQSSDQALNVLIPAMPNAHSHVFQRAMAGLSEYKSDLNADSFWSWRDLMYQLASFAWYADGAPAIWRTSPLPYILRRIAGSVGK